MLVDVVVNQLVEEEDPFMSMDLSGRQPGVPDESEEVTPLDLPPIGIDPEYRSRLRYTVGDGVILDPGPWHNSWIFEPYFWDRAMEDDGEEKITVSDEEEYTILGIAPDEREQFPELGNFPYAIAGETEDGVRVKLYSQSKMERFKEYMLRKKEAMAISVDDLPKYPPSTGIDGDLFGDVSDHSDDAGLMHDAGRYDGSVNYVAYFATLTHITDVDVGRYERYTDADDTIFTIVAIHPEDAREFGLDPDSKYIGIFFEEDSQTYLGEIYTDARDVLIVVKDWVFEGVGLDI